MRKLGGLSGKAPEGAQVGDIITVYNIRGITLTLNTRASGDWSARGFDLNSIQIGDTITVVEEDEYEYVDENAIVEDIKYKFKKASQEKGANKWTNVHYNQNRDDERETPLTFDILTDGNIIWKSVGGTTKAIEYNINGTGWTKIVSTLEGTPIPVHAGDVVWFRGNNPQYCINGGIETGQYSCFSGTTCQFNVRGNILSLFYRLRYPEMTEFEPDGVGNPRNRNCENLFVNCVNLISARDLLLLPTKLHFGAYCCMFAGCTSMISAPRHIDADKIDASAFQSMFSGCTSLKQAPETMSYNALSAGTSSSYYNIGFVETFDGCTSLEKSPTMKVGTPHNNCMPNTFRNCTSLRYITCLNPSWNSSYTPSWVQGVPTGNGTFVKKAGVNWGSGTSGIPNGWNVVDA